MIQSVSDWNTFADAVTDGTSYYGKYFKLTTDITVSKTAGNPTNIWSQILSTSFRGTFDGDGHTITLNDVAYTGEFGGLFRMLGVGGTVKNLKVNGSVSSSSNNVGGIVGVTSAYQGQCLIENCWSDVTITSSGTYNAGIVAYTNNTTYIKGCIFTGKLLGTGSVGGGICGHTVNTASTSIQDCIFAPSQITMNTASSKTFCGTDNLTTNCYYYTDATFSTTQGTQAYKVTLAANPAAGGTVDGGDPTTNYGFIKAYSNGLLCDGIYYANGSVSLRATANEGYTFSQWTDSNNSNPRSITVSSDASYTATFTQGGGGGTPKPLPYSYGFENNDLTSEGWTMVTCDGSTGINSNAKRSGNYGFQFRWNTTPPQYLVSPQLTGTTDGVDVEFYYKNNSSSWTETFKVGYSTSSSDPTSFTYGEVISSINDQTWTKYEGSFHAGTKYVAIKLLSNDKYYLYLDDFSFTAPTFITEITSVADWEAFCDAVNGGHSYSGETVTLMNGITVTTMAGTSSNPFRGTFDGQGNKITLSLSANENACAPFRYINGATIQNLKVDGTVNDNGYKQLSGLVGYAAGGSSTIYNCLVSATLSTTTIYAKGDATLSLTLGGSVTGIYEADHGTLTQSGNNWSLAMEANNTVISAVNCFAPTNLSVSHLAPTSATLTWGGGDAGYNVEVGTASTTTETVEVLNEGFESGALPSGWTLTSTGSKNWAVSTSVCDGNSPKTGSYAVGTPQGTYNRSEEMYLITPTMDLSDAISAELHFYYCNKAWASDTDPFKVYYRIGVTGEWHELFSTTDAHGSWTEGTITLTNLAADYQIGFYRKDNYAYGAAVDDIVVTKTYCPTKWSTFTENVTSPYTFNGETGMEYLVRVSSTCGQVSNEVTFTPQVLTYEFTNADGTDNANWDELTNWQYSNPSITVTTLPTINDDVQIKAPATIPSGCIAQANSITLYTDAGTGDVYGSITIENGGQLQHNNEGVAVTVKRGIAAYGNNHVNTNLGYKIISFPVSGIDLECECIEGLLTETDDPDDPSNNPYDFYTFNY